MPPQLSYPGVYVEELSSNVHTIVGVATSIAAFVGWAPQGATDEAVLVTTWSDFESEFGGLQSGFPLGYAVNQFFGNGGNSAYIVRLASRDAAKASVTVGSLVFTALNPGDWANDYQIAIKNQMAKKTPGDTQLSKTSRFRVQVLYAPPGKTAVVVESFENLGIKNPDDQGRYFVDVIEKGSNYIGAAVASGAAQPPVVPDDMPPPNPSSGASATTTSSAVSSGVAASSPTATESPATTVVTAATRAAAPAIGNAATATGPGSTGGLGSDAAATGSASTLPPNQLTGGANGAPLYANTPPFETALNTGCTKGGGGIELLEYVNIFNLLCVPGEITTTTLSDLEHYCEGRRAFLIADCDPGIRDPQKYVDNQGSGLTGTNAAFYFPWVQAPDPLNNNVVRAYPPCGFVAGMCATTDSNRGVWKAPAGTETALVGVSGVDIPLTNAQNGFLNPLGINCIRTFPVYGTILWGARTTQGNDEMASQWKYVPVRRTALFIEESLYRGTQWVVFEPNDEPLWAAIRLNVGAFMHDLFRQGAFQGSTPKQAYLVKCDSETTTQNDIDRGIVNILVGFAPLKPAEFVVLQIQQLAGQIQT